MRRATWVTALMLLISPTLFSLDPGPDIASLYVNAAFQAYSNGAYDHAASLTGIALEFAPASSDALILHALLLAQSRAPVADAIQAAEDARRLDSWNSFRRDYGSLVLARLLNRVGRYQDALDVLEQVPSGELVPGIAGDVRPDLLFERLRALSMLGRTAELAEAARSARDAYPDDARYFWFVLRQEPHPSLEYRAEIERLRAASGSSDPAADELLFLYGMRVTGGEREWARRTLLDRSWNDPRLALLYAEDDPERALALFRARAGFTDYAVYVALRQALSGAVRSDLVTDAASFDGVSLSDPDHDGYWNQRLTVRDGMITRWEVDADQDGVTEVDLHVSGTRPTRVRMTTASSDVELEYGQYPYLASTVVDRPEPTRRITLRPRSVRLDAVRDLPPMGPAFSSDVSLAPMRVVTTDELAEAAIAIDFLGESGRSIRRVSYESGVASRVQEDLDGNGVWDHLVVYRDGAPAEGVRDLDDDGYFEVAEGYTDGELAVLAVDADDDGTPELYERHQATRDREWDVNGDGRIDAREFEYWTDAVRRVFR